MEAWLGSGGHLVSFVSGGAAHPVHASLDWEYPVNWIWGSALTRRLFFPIPSKPFGVAACSVPFYFYR